MSLDLRFSEGRLVKVLMGEPTGVDVRHITNRSSGGEPFVAVEIFDNDGSLTAYLPEPLAAGFCGLLSPLKLERPVDFPAAVDPVAAIEGKAPKDQPTSHVQAVNEPAPKTWIDYRRGCLSTYWGGYHESATYQAFRHGMETVFNLLEDEFPPAELCKAAPNLLAACKAALIAMPFNCYRTRVWLSSAISEVEKSITPAVSVDPVAAVERKGD